MVPRAAQHAQRVLLVLVESVGAVAALQLAVAALHDRLAFQGADDGAEGLVALRMRHKVCTAEDISRNTCRFNAKFELPIPTAVRNYLTTQSYKVRKCTVTVRLYVSLCNKL